MALQLEQTILCLVFFVGSDCQCTSLRNTIGCLVVLVVSGDISNLTMGTDVHAIGSLVEAATLWLFLPVGESVVGFEQSPWVVVLSLGKIVFQIYDVPPKTLLAALVDKTSCQHEVGGGDLVCGNLVLIKDIKFHVCFFEQQVEDTGLPELFFTLYQCVGVVLEFFQVVAGGHIPALKSSIEMLVGIGHGKGLPLVFFKAEHNVLDSRK